MKALFIGLGSIGQRHLRNLKTVVPKEELEIIAYRHSGTNVAIEDGQARTISSLEDELGFTSFTNLDKALAEKPNITFITNPSSLHIPIATKVAKAGSHLFIEKPLGNSMNGTAELLRLVRKHDLVTMIGYQTRFHPLYQFAKETISDTNSFGKTLSASFEWGTYLPSHHPYEDYSKGYAARAELGGGAVLGLIHDLDIIHSFWGEPNSICVSGGKLSDLNMNVEDTCLSLLTYNNNGNIFPVSSFLSYAQTKETHQFRIQGCRQTLLCDFANDKAKLYDKSGKLLKDVDSSQFARNDLFINEMREFIDCVTNNKQPSSTLEDGIKTLQLALNIKNLINTKQTEN